MDLILSDIHSNLHAFRAVLSYVRRRPVSRFVCLGDLVGYGARPNQVIEHFRALRPRVAVRGNHDRACAGSIPEPSFSLAAQMASEWTRTKLTRSNRRFLDALPVGPLWVGRDYQIVHGSPGDEDTYLLHPRDVLAALEQMEGELCFFGHTHLPGIFELDGARQKLRWITLAPCRWFQLEPGRKYLVNPGSVGQPRDHDPRVSFMTYDPEQRRLRLHRKEYNHSAAAQAILDAGLHPHLAERLYTGL